MNYLVTKVGSFFSWPILNPIVGFVVGYILNIAFDKTILGVNLLAIDWEVNAKVDAVKEKLKNIGDANTQAEIEAAQKEAADAIFDLIDYGGKPN